MSALRFQSNGSSMIEISCHRPSFIFPQIWTCLAAGGGQRGHYRPYRRGQRKLIKHLWHNFDLYRLERFPESMACIQIRSSELCSNSTTVLGKLSTSVHFCFHKNINLLINILYWYSGHQHGGSAVLKNTVIYSPTAFSKIIYRLTTNQFLVARNFL